MRTNTIKVHRETKQREAILEVLRNSRSHPTADQIYDEVRKVIPNISKGTVYRNLQVLQDTGAAIGLDIDGAMRRFDGITENHYHFRCVHCGCVLDVDVPFDSELNQKIAERTGLQISSHNLEFRGICQRCQSK
jgi:Fur family transcriptional regulator, peroxide stress response regulator